MAEEGKKAQAVKLAQGRSPAYPYIPLDKAVERVEQIHRAGGTRQTLPPETFYEVWDLGSQSSGARQTMAALNHFGLVEYLGRGEDRKVKLSDLARKIVLDLRSGSPERIKALQEAALAPAIHKELHERFGDSALLPADVVLETFLVRDKGYNSAAAGFLIKEYKASRDFAGLAKPVDLPKNGGGHGDDKEPGVSTPANTTTPKDEGGNPPLGVPLPIKPAAAGVRQDTLSLDEGIVVLQLPAKLSAAGYEDFETWIQLQLRKIKRGIEQ